MRWNKKDQHYVRQVIDFISTNTEGGMSGFARDIATTRQVINNWRTRGKIPPAMHSKVLDAAKKAVERAKDNAQIAAELTSSKLHPLSRDIIQAHEKSA